MQISAWFLTDQEKAATYENESKTGFMRNLVSSGNKESSYFNWST